MMTPADSSKDFLRPNTSGGLAQALGGLVQSVGRFADAERPHLLGRVPAGLARGEGQALGEALHLHSYEVNVRVHVVPELGRLQLTQLTPQQVQRFINTKLASGLAPKTVTDIRQTLHAALAHAERWG